MIKVNLGGRGGKGMSVPRTAKQKQASVRNLIKARARRKSIGKQNTRQHNISSEEWGKVLKLAKTMRIDKYNRAKGLSR